MGKFLLQASDIVFFKRRRIWKQRTQLKRVIDFGNPTLRIAQNPHWQAYCRARICGLLPSGDHFTEQRKQTLLRILAKLELIVKRRSLKQHLRGGWIGKFFQHWIHVRCRRDSPSRRHVGRTVRKIQQRHRATLDQAFQKHRRRCRDHSIGHLDRVTKA